MSTLYWVALAKPRQACNPISPAVLFWQVLLLRQTQQVACDCPAAAAPVAAAPAVGIAGIAWVTCRCRVDVTGLDGSAFGTGTGSIGSVFSLARRRFAWGTGAVGLLALADVVGAVVEPVGIIIVGSCGAEALLLGVIGRLGSVGVLGED